MISHFLIFEEFFKSVLEEVNPKKGFFSCSYKMHVTVKHDLNTPITEVEKRSVIDSCEHAGARRVTLNGRKD
tara:strand:+ start:210 stop:425 length:216 start_codon:yes stop_codon:yes gene_type:complete